MCLMPYGEKKRIGLGDLFITLTNYYIMFQRCMYSAKFVLYILAALLPLLFLPLPLGVAFGREVVFTLLIILAFMLWLVATLASGQIRYAHSPLLYIAGALALLSAVSTFISASPFVSAFYNDVTAERLSWLILGLLAMVTVGGVLRRREEGGTLLLVLIFTGALAALMSAIQFLFGASLLMTFGLANGTDANVIGTANSLALFYAALFMMTVGLLLSAVAAEWKVWARGALGGAAILFLLNLLAIGFKDSWIMVLGTSVLLFGLLLLENTKMRGMDKGGMSGSRFGPRHWVAMILIIFSVVMLMIQGPLIGGFKISPEVSPSFSGTLAIARSVFAEGPIKVFFGSGPGTFGLLWAKYKNIGINQTAFWGIRFSQGQSWMTTLAPTVGVLGTGAFLGFLAVALVMFLRALLSGGQMQDEGDDDMNESVGAQSMKGGGALARPLFLGFVALMISAFLYPANPSLVLLFFLVIGILIFVSAIPEPDDMSPDLLEIGMREDVGADGTSDDMMPENKDTYRPGTSDGRAWPQVSFWSIRERAIRFTAPWAVFVSSLAILFLLALSVAAVYGEINHVRAVLALSRGIAAANKGDVDLSLAEFVAADAIEPHDTHALEALVQMRIAKVQQLIQIAATGKNVQQDFQNAVSSGIQDAQRLTTLYPEESIVWRLQGALYESVIPFIQGSERFASTAYEKASQREPVNPQIYTDWGRAGLVFVDRIGTIENQAQNNKDRDQLEQTRRQNLDQVTQILQKAIQMKADFAAAHFLLAQASIRKGNLDEALKSVENAKAAAPFDIGVAFELGLLYYQKGEFDGAEAEFERAVSINDNYSNARYFLGLIYDRKGDKVKATEQFAKISQLNPDNEEVKHILANLAADKAALDGIVPPAPPPEKRGEVPLKQKEQQK